ncbi:MAG TPA: acyl-CoA dehydrogenase family protein [Acidimicrobiia bacterium]|nr:acyl-CoA dehydrogenase family protein [Acidimicrobiia bacterium]
MDTRDTPEQAELRRSARRLARDLGPSTVADLDDVARRTRLGDAVRDAGWLELRGDTEDAAPVAGGVEAAIVADALGGAVADVAFAGPVLAADLARRGAVVDPDPAVVAFSAALIDTAVLADGTTASALYAVDGDETANTAYVLSPEGCGYRLATVRVEPAPHANIGSDLTRAVRMVPTRSTLQVMNDQRRLLTDDDLAAWTALGLAITSADLVGVMRGVLDMTVAYAAQRSQFGVPVGSFQAVQHLLAEARCLMEGSFSVALHAAWTVDNLAPDDARSAGRVAKAYCTRAARTVCETAVQVHGGVGNTWECMAHVYMRRALLSSQWFGDDGVQLGALGRERLGIDNGLS